VTVPPGAESRFKRLYIWRELSGDGRVLFGTRLARLFAYGFLSVVLALYLAEIGLGEAQIGLLLTLTLAGDAAISLWITTNADRVGRRRMLIAGAALMVLAALVFASARVYALLVLAAVISVISPSGYEVGPFLSIEKASLSQLVSGDRRTGIFTWYNLVGSFATALGALASWIPLRAAWRRSPPVLACGSRMARKISPASSTCTTPCTPGAGWRRQKGLIREFHVKRAVPRAGWRPIRYSPGRERRRRVARVRGRLASTRILLESWARPMTSQPSSPHSLRASSRSASFGRPQADLKVSTRYSQRFTSSMDASRQFRGVSRETPPKQL